MSDSSSSTTRRSKLTVERLEDRTVPTFLPRTGIGISSPAMLNGQLLPTSTNQSAVGGESIAIGDIVPEANPLLTRSEYVLGSGPGQVGTVSIYDNNGTPLFQFVPFAGFTGGLNVAVGDVVGDGKPEIIVTVAGNGPPLVGVFTPAGQVISAFVVGGNTSYMGGLNVAVGNVLGGIGNGGFGGGGNSQFKSEIIVGTATALPAVVVMDAFGNIQQSFFAFAPSSGVGVTVAASSIDTSRTPGSGGGGGGGFGGRGRAPDTNSYAEIIVGAASKFPAVSVWSVWQGTPTQLELYFAFDPTIPFNQTGVTVTAGSTDGQRGAEIYVALTNGSRIRAFGGQSGALLADFTAFPLGYSRVVNMAVGNVSGPFDSTDDSNGNFGGNGNQFFNQQDLAVVAGDGAFFQEPRVFFGLFGRAAGLNGP